MNTHIYTNNANLHLYSINVFTPYSEKNMLVALSRDEDRDRQREGGGEKERVTKSSEKRWVFNLCLNATSTLGEKNCVTVLLTGRYKHPTSTCVADASVCLFSASTLSRMSKTTTAGTSEAALVSEVRVPTICPFLLLFFLSFFLPVHEEMIHPHIHTFQFR